MAAGDESDHPEIIPLLTAPYGSGFERDKAGVLQPVKGWEPGQTEEE